MNAEEIKNKLITANKTYREGSPIISDQEFDDLLEQYKSIVSYDEYEQFRNSMFEEAGQTRHPFIMGSLDKLKAEEPENVIKFINKTIKTKINISSKIDGISCRLHYENGNLISATTRGDGYFGQNITEKIIYVQRIPKMIGYLEPIDIRGELVIFRNDFDNMSGFSNARNACAGIMNHKTINPDDISKISFIAYTVLGDKFTKKEQFEFIKSIGFETAWNEDIEKSKYSESDLVSHMIEVASNDYGYDTDGLVICDDTYVNEERYRPTECKAFKINQQTGITTLLNVVFDGPSKNGVHTPVGILEPIELGGAVIGRVTLHNLDFISNMNLKYGSKIKILRSGDVIPKVVELVENNDSCVDIVIPEICNCCGSPLYREGVNMVCHYENCKDQIIERIKLFIKKLGCKHSDSATLDKFKIHTFNDLIHFTPNTKYKSEVKLFEEINNKVFTRSKKDLLSALNFNGLSEKLVNKIVDFYGWDNIVSKNFNGLPEGIGSIMLGKFKDDLDNNLKIVDSIVTNSRYNYHEIITETKKTDIVGSVCFTGKLFTMSRNDASKLAENAGYEVRNSVTKGLTYLVTNDKNSGSSKNKKASQLGTKIIDENEFIKLVKNDVCCGIENF